MTTTTDRIAASPAPASELDRLSDHLIISLDLARSMQMPLLERLLEMSLIEVGQTLAAQQKRERDRGLR